MTENQYLIIGLRLSLWQTVSEPTDVNDSSDVLARPFSTKQREKASKTKWLFCAQPHPEPGSTCRVQANIPDRNDVTLSTIKYYLLEKLSCLLGFDRRHPVRELGVFHLTFKNSTSICPESD
ncbi:hypothetical protein T02_15261 [Trichinella nativa]|uniref:Uncharacterized protein n=3 Tax=Trichinella TaxID=6333 RepID=A0A0V1LLI0_9BILA|nr:hypothetical protein T06_1581 [Trichinella sp. T6]KRY20928.1 hypothetical protein T12_12041 [Trichinella patagoniensis]KRY59462.1 hypothetical protein T03_6289 [Trichinella britovi]KRZ60365.1 hypothetical protein T02_15261 [Trichinella nativa]